jgi:deferrochelatase/peroxidase EfeB
LGTGALTIVVGGLIMPRGSIPKSGRTRLRAITTFSPIPEEALDELSERLRALRATPSPFAAVPGTHFARLAVLPRNAFRPQPRPRGMRRSARLLDLLTHAGRAQRPDQPSLSYLLFSANYDGVFGASDDSEYLDGLRLELRETADQLWGLCSDYPGWSDRDAFVAFFAARSLPANYLVTASDDEPTVERIRSALQLRQRVIDLAIGADGLPDEELVKRFHGVFGLPDDRRHPGMTVPERPTAEPALLDPPSSADVLEHLDQSIPTDPDLEDVQNLVISGYAHHDAVRHLLLGITDPITARHWLARVADVIPTAEWARTCVDRLDREAVQQDRDSAVDGRDVAPEFATHVAFSYRGLSRLGLPESELAGFSSEFRSGMASREAGLTPGRGTGTWRPPFASESTPGMGRASTVDVLLIFSATDQKTLGARLSDRGGLLPGPDDGLQLLQELTAARIRSDRGARPEPGTKPLFQEHFGFAARPSQPRIHGVTTGRGAAEVPAGEVLLGYRDIDGDTAGAGLPAALARNGTYLVYRKLEQDVHAFRDLTRTLAEKLADRVETGTDVRELAAAKLVGRWRDGTPLTPTPAQQPASASGEPLGFQESDAEGHGCPVGAHIRRANPRDSRPTDQNATADTGAEVGLEATLALRHRMLRRGIPYGTPLPDDAADGDDSGGERGLLFVALVGNLRRQFEFVQAHWMSDGNAFRLGTDRDLLSGATEHGNKFVVQGIPPTFVQPPKPLVTCRGGEYFFLPGIAALKRIAGHLGTTPVHRFSEATDDTPSPPRRYAAFEP